MSEDSIYNLMQRISKRNGGEQTTEGENYSHSSKGNEWMISMNSSAGGGDIFESLVESDKADKSTLLFDHIFDISRRTNANVTSINKFDSARPVFSNPLIKIPNDIWGPKLEKILVDGILVEMINLKRFSNSGEVNQLVQQINFENNLLQAILQDDDFIWIEFRTQKYTNTMNRIDQNNQAKGSTSFVYDIAKAQTTLGG